MAYRRFFVLLAGVVLATTITTGAAPAADTAAVMAPIMQFANGFNTGDLKSSVAMCTSPAFVIDDFAPNVWSGATACADWATAVVTSLKKLGITNGYVALRTPWHVVITGDRAYAVVPTTFTYKQHGKSVTESGSILTVALQKTAAGWRIAAWSWAQH